MLQPVRVQRQEPIGRWVGYWIPPKQNTEIIEICEEMIQVRFCGDTALSAEHERSVCDQLVLTVLCSITFVKLATLLMSEIRCAEWNKKYKQSKIRHSDANFVSKRIRTCCTLLYKKLDILSTSARCCCLTHIK